MAHSHPWLRWVTLSMMVPVGLIALACGAGSGNSGLPPVLGVDGGSGTGSDAGMSSDSGTSTSDDAGLGMPVGPACQHDTDCSTMDRPHCILQPGQPGACVQCWPPSGFTCPADYGCLGGVCVHNGTSIIAGTSCHTDSDCTDSSRPHCVSDNTSSGNRVCAQCTPEGLGCMSPRVCIAGACVSTGSLQFTLVWDHPGDLDLHVVTPAGNEIYYASRSADMGMLDRDDTTGTGPENIFWTASPPSGTYLVCVDPYRISTPTNFTVTITHTGSAPMSFHGTRTMSSGNVACSRTSPYFVTAFTQ